VLTTGEQGVRVAALAAAGVVAMALAGCGGGSSEEQVRAAVADFGRAAAAKDFRHICRDLFATSLLDEMRSVQIPCEAALQAGLGKVRAPRLTVKRVSVSGHTAQALVRTSASGQRPSTDTLSLRREGGHWRIASLVGQGPPAPKG
jgi:hypothetical protein